MKSANQPFLSTALAGSLITLTGLCAAADPSPSATAPSFLNGGTYCFHLGSHEGEDYRHLKLVVEPASGTGSYRIAGVNAMEHGRSGQDTWLSQYSGTATIGPSNDPNVTEPTLQIGLTGTSYGVTHSGDDEIWLTQYTLQLNPWSLIGRIYGNEMESNPLHNGQPVEWIQHTALRLKVTPGPCSHF